MALDFKLGWLPRGLKVYAVGLYLDGSSRSWSDAPSVQRLLTDAVGHSTLRIVPWC